MATKIFGVTPNQPLGSPAATPGSFLFYDGYQELTNPRIGIDGSSSATPNLLEDNAIFVDIGDTILFVDYRSRASFSNNFLDAVPDTNSVTRIYNVLLNRDPDSNGLAHYTNTTNYTQNWNVVYAIRNSPEYRPNKSSLFEYPILIFNQNGGLVWQSNNYGDYVDYYEENLLDHYNKNYYWDYNLDGNIEPVQSKSKEEFGQDHYQNHGRGEGRSLASFNITEVEHFTIRTAQSQNRFGGIIVKNYTANTFKNYGLISVNELRGWMNNHTDLGPPLSEKNISINSLFSKGSLGTILQQTDFLLYGSFEQDEDSFSLQSGEGNWSNAYGGGFRVKIEENLLQFNFEDGGWGGYSSNPHVIVQKLSWHKFKSPVILEVDVNSLHRCKCYIGFSYLERENDALNYYIGEWPRLEEEYGPYTPDDIFNQGYEYIHYEEGDSQINVQRLDS